MDAVGELSEGVHDVAGTNVQRSRAHRLRHGHRHEPLGVRGQQLWARRMVLVRRGGGGGRLPQPHVLFVLEEGGCGGRDRVYELAQLHRR